MTVTAAELGTAPGAVYRPELEIVPIVALPPVIAFTCQVTVVLLVFSTVAVNCCVPPTATVADAGEIITVTATGVCRREASTSTAEDFQCTQPRRGKPHGRRK